MGEPIRVLQVVTHMNRGGLETMLMNYYRNIDRNKVQFDFLTHRPENEKKDYDDEIRGLGGKIYHMPVLNPFSPSYMKSLDRFFKEHKEYKIVHSHLDCLSAYPLKAAKKNGVPVRIAHSHNTSQEKNLKYLIKDYSKKQIPKYATHLFACGKEAGKWMFGNQPFEVINNAVDTTKFAFNDLSRSEIRTELNIPADAFVIGNVGRFELAKNHSLLVDIFYHFLQKHPKSLLLLVGDGSLKKEIEIKVKKLGISNSVYFAGVRGDIEKLYSAMDIMLMPSLFEGLPFVAIEAQCSGLKCLLSDAVTSEAVVTDLCDSESLEASIEQWCDKIELLMKKNVLRTEYSLIVAEKKYDINYTANRLLQIYTQY